MAARRKSKRSKPRCKNKEESLDLELLVGDIPNMSDGWIPTSGRNPAIGDNDSGQILFASLPVPDESNGDFVSYCVFANESSKVYDVKATNLMEDLPDYYNHVLSKAETLPFVRDAIQAFNDGIEEKKQEKAEAKAAAKQAKKRAARKRRKERRRQKVVFV